jgi:hypothetical protein
VCRRVRQIDSHPTRHAYLRAQVRRLSPMALGLQKSPGGQICLFGVACRDHINSITPATCRITQNGAQSGVSDAGYFLGLWRGWLGVAWLGVAVLYSRLP